MQACKNTYDRRTNKVANELNKLGISKKTKPNVTGKRQHSPQETVSDVKEWGGEEEMGRLGVGGVACGFH